jgi:hypothetical protein
MEPKLLSIGDAAKFLGVTIQTLRRWDKSGKLPSFRPSPTSHRYYKKEDLYLFINDLRIIAKNWAFNETPGVPQNEYYCPSSDIFQARLIKMQNELGKIQNIEKIFSLIVSITGEIGNNSFDHNLGIWPDISGIFFGYDINKGLIVLADRGQGILATLKRVKPELNNSEDALKVAFTEIISGRAPESRGNGLKFVRNVILDNPISLLFQTGEAELYLEKEKNDLDIKTTDIQFHGCTAIINF